MRPFCKVCGNFMVKIGKTQKNWRKTPNGRVAVDKTNIYGCKAHPEADPTWNADDI